MHSSVKFPVILFVCFITTACIFSGTPKQKPLTPREEYKSQLSKDPVVVEQSASWVIIPTGRIEWISKTQSTPLQ